MLPRRLPGIVLSAALLAALAACSGSDGEPAADASPSPRVTRPPTLTKVTVPPGTGKGFVGARNDVTVQSCKGDAGTWTATGTVTNATTTRVDYRIYTSFLTKDNDTRGLVQTDVRAVAPKAKVTWRAALALPEQALSCVLRVERTKRS